MQNTSTTTKIQIGDNVGDWTVISNPLKLPGKSYRSILVRCKCQNEQYIPFTTLYQNKSTKCSTCSRGERKEKRDLPLGASYGNWVVTGESFILKKQTYIPVRCGCGFETNINKYCLISPTSSMCCSTCASFKGVGDLAGAYITELKSRSEKKRGLEFNISTQYIWDLLVQQDFKCALTGMPITVSKNWRKEKFTASLDRIDSTKGYVIGNVQWLHKTVNRLKSNFTEEQLIYWVGQIYHYQNNQQFKH
jgi:hypothetical protein